MYDVNAIRADFPILSREVNGKPLVYLDNGASAQKPQVVIDAINQAYSQEYANVHRGLHYLSNLATEKYEGVRAKVANFLNAGSEEEIIFNTGTTEALNLVSYAWAAPRLEAGDEIILTVMEHHANIVPWHFLRERQGVVLKWVDIEPDGSLDPQKVIDAMGPRTKMVCVTHMSNVLGTVVDVAAISAAARERGIVSVIDGSQAAVHGPVDVQQIGCDFYAITGHKLYGPSGSGAMYARAERQAEMRPFMGGGDMIREVTKDNVTWADAPMKFEAGTPGSLRRRIIDSAISAPVLPQDTATVASPLRTDSSVDHMEVSRPWRTTWLGLSVIWTVSLASRISHRPRRCLRRFTNRFRSAALPCRMKATRGFFLADRAIPATTAAGPRSPPMASTEMTMRPSDRGTEVPPSLGPAGV